MTGSVVVAFGCRKMLVSAESGSRMLMLRSKSLTVNKVHLVVLLLGAVRRCVFMIHWSRGDVVAPPTYEQGEVIGCAVARTVCC